LQALSVAGGLSATASPNKTTILRRTSGKFEVVKVPLKPMMSAKADDITMHADDILFVPGSLSKKIANGGFQQILSAASLAALIKAY
jgi:polysaccharide export outer membrane protein